ncbi:MAG: PH domain-containing protein [Anaerolineales bacterium]|nr:PH domain-containing protein [Anaerolineales bacterium]
MGYVEQSLSSGERIILKARLHWGMFINPVLGVIAACFFLLLSVVPFLIPYEALAGFEGFSLGESDYGILQPTAGVCCAGIGLLWLLSMFLNLLTRIAIFFSTEFAVTNKRVIGKSGVLRRRSLEVILSKIESVSVDEPFWGRILNFGTVTIKGSGGTVQPFPFISDAMALRMQINNLIPPTGQ